MKKYIIPGIASCFIGIVFSCSKPNPPKASFSYHYTGYTVYYTNTSETYGTPSTYTWNFADFTPLKQGENQVHTYGGSGMHDVTLTVSNEYGYSKSQQTVVIKEEIAKISTSFGDMFLWLYNETPNHKANFLHNLYINLYEGTTFHKVIPGQMIAGGDYFSRDNDPGNDGRGGPLTLMPEFVDTLKNIYGAVGAVRPPDNEDSLKKSNAWQFYIITNPGGYPQWNGNHTVFGCVLKGMNVAEKIASQPADANNRPITDIRMSVIISYQSKGEIFENYGYRVK